MKTNLKFSVQVCALVTAIALMSFQNDTQAGHNSYRFGNAYRNGTYGYSPYGYGPYGYGSGYVNPYARGYYGGYGNNYQAYGSGPYGAGIAGYDYGTYDYYTPTYRTFGYGVIDPYAY